MGAPDDVPILSVAFRRTKIEIPAAYARINRHSTIKRTEEETSEKEKRAEKKRSGEKSGGREEPEKLKDAKEDLIRIRFNCG